MKKNLGIKESERYGPMSCCSVGPSGKKGKDPIIFPSLELIGPQIEALGIADAKVGDRFTAEVTFCVSRSEASRSYSDPTKKTQRMSIEVEGVPSPAEPVEASDDETEDSEMDMEPEVPEDKGARSPKGFESLSPKDAGIASEDDDEEETD